MIKPLFENLEQESQIKMQLYIIIPNSYNIFYSEISKEYPSFQKDIIEFYSYYNIKERTENIKEFLAFS